MKAGWEVRPLGEVCEIYQPKTISKKKMIDDGAYPVFGANGVIGRYDQFNHEKAQLLITCRGATCGSVNVSEPFSWVTGNSMVVRPKADGLDQDYLKYFFLGAVDLNGVITGAAQPQITRASLSPVTLCVPPLEEQKRIVAVLDAAFEGLTRAKENAEANLQNARELFESATDAVFAQSGDWPHVPVQEFGQVFDGPHATPKTVDEGPLFLGISSLVDGRIELTKTRHVTDTDFEKWTRRVVPKSGDVVFAYETRLGQVGLIPDGIKCCLGRRMGLVRLDKAKIRPDYFVLCYLSPSFQRFIDKKTVRGATVDRISIKEFPSFPFPLPDIQSQGQIIEKLHSVRLQHDKILIAAANKLTDIAGLRQSLLQKAFAGELT